ncbi:MAG TPA: tetratricopeptide repeat protein [Sphingobacteriaceae bacterium]|nr:tetratricopeptide repeat protein [Sphingobacteriaceae bacterium]
MRKFSLFFFLAGTMLASCAGLKNQDRPQYDLMDNLTSRYNIIFHAKQIIEQAEAENRQSFSPNFYHDLPVFIEPTASSTQSHAALMDSVLTKTRRVINEKDQGKYLDDAYFLMGRANYVKGQYYNAAEFFAYVAQTYADQPKLRQEAWIWQTRALLQLGTLSEASSVLDSVLAYVEDHRGSRGHAYATRAAYHLLRGEKQEAVTYLEAATRNRSKKEDRLRWHYLLGQLLEEQERYSEAVSHYRKVARSNVSYEMAFQAGLSQVFIESAFSDDPEARTNRLRRMLRADKNQEFKDQIHYYIAEAHLWQGNNELAERHYQHALNQNSTNMHQKTQSYLSLADLYLSQSAYESARVYYDSAAMVLPADFRDVDMVRRKLINLPELIDNLLAVAREEELQDLAMRSPLQREAAIDSVIAVRFVELQKAEEARTQQLKESSSRQASRNSGFQPSPFDQGFGSGQADAYADNRFYFNNPDAVGMGVSAFRRQWGNRPLADGWRLSAQQTSSTGIQGATLGEPASPVPDSIAGTVIDLANVEESGAEAGAPLDSAAFFAQQREMILLSLPLSDRARMASHGVIQKALAQNGAIYRFNLRDYPSSITAYENLLDRYPSHSEAAMWLFQLYQLNQTIDPQQAEHYKDELLGRFPESNYANIILDPTYLQRVEQEKRRSDAAYAAVYELYVEGRFEEALGKINEEVTRSGSNAQFEYLRALVVGRTSDLADFESVLMRLVHTFPDDSLVTPLAESHLAYLTEHPQEFAGRVPVLEALDGMSERMLEEPRLTPWPQLVIHSGPIITRGTPEQGQAGRSELGLSGPGAVSAVPVRELGAAPAIAKTPEQTTYRDVALLPDTAIYFFVIHVMHPTVNLAPSRFGIGQFNRSRYADAGISHQLKTVNNESQLIYVGPFQTYQEGKVFEARFMPLIEEIMKIPSDAYHAFLITESVFGTLSDFEKIDDYYSFYSSQ